MLQESIGIAGGNFPQHHDPFYQKQSHYNSTQQDYMYGRRSNPDLFSNEDEFESRNKASNANMSPIDPTKTFNLKVASIDQSGLRSLKQKEPHLNTVKLDVINIPQNKGQMSHRVLKESQSDTEKASKISGKVKLPKNISDNAAKFTQNKRKNSVSKVNLVYTDIEGDKKSNLPEIQTAKQ